MGNDELVYSLEEAREHARSFPGLRPPTGAEEFWREKRGKDMYIYYSDGKGNYWHNTESQIAFEKEMQAAKRWKRKNRRR